MMHKIVLILFLLTGIPTLSATVFAQDDLYISVKSFGAKGDGISDDTEAIQKALSQSGKAGYSTKSIPGTNESLPIYFGASKTVFFPTGIYKISKTLNVGSYLKIIGEKAALIPAKSFKAAGTALEGPVWQLNIEGLQFVGFNTAIRLDSKAVDCGKIVIADCDFLANKTAIELYAQSAMTVIRENRFNGNDKVLLLNSGDKVDMYDNWITAAPLKGMHDAQIINKAGVLHFDRNLLVPVPPAGGIEPAWINNYNIVYINGVRQGGEPGSFTLVNNFAQAATQNPTIPNGVSIRDSDCFAVYGNTSTYFQPAALRLINIPNSIVLDNLKGFVNAKVIDFSQITVKNPAALREVALDPFFIKVDIRNMMGAHYKHNNGTDIPENLKKFIVP